MIIEDADSDVLSAELPKYQDLGAEIPMTSYLINNCTLLMKVHINEVQLIFAQQQLDLQVALILDTIVWRGASKELA